MQKSRFWFDAYGEIRRSDTDDAEFAGKLKQLLSASDAHVPDDRWFTPFDRKLMSFGLQGEQLRECFVDAGTAS